MIKLWSWRLGTLATIFSHKLLISCSVSLVKTTGENANHLKGFVIIKYICFYKNHVVVNLDYEYAGGHLLSPRMYDIGENKIKPTLVGQLKTEICTYFRSLKCCAVTTAGSARNINVKLSRFFSFIKLFYSDFLGKLRGGSLELVLSVFFNYWLTSTVKYEFSIFNKYDLSLKASHMSCGKEESRPVLIHFLLFYVFLNKCFI